MCNNEYIINMVVVLVSLVPSNMPGTLMSSLSYHREGERESMCGTPMPPMVGRPIKHGLGPERVPRSPTTFDYSSISTTRRYAPCSCMLLGTLDQRYNFRIVNYL